jgi:hypothetical protein
MTAWSRSVNEQVIASIYGGIAGAAVSALFSILLQIRQEKRQGELERRQDLSEKALAIFRKRTDVIFSIHQALGRILALDTPDRILENDTYYDEINRIWSTDFRAMTFAMIEEEESKDNEMSLLTHQLNDIVGNYMAVLSQYKIGKIKDFKVEEKRRKALESARDVLKKLSQL